MFSDFEDSTIGGSYTVVGLHTCWLGTFRTSIGRNTTLVGNQTADPDGNEIATNRTGGNMVCLSNLPAVQFGDSGRVAQYRGPPRHRPVRVQRPAAEDTV